MRIPRAEGVGIGAMSHGRAVGLSPSREAEFRRRVGQIVAASVVYFVVAIVVLHWLRPEVDPVAAVTSEYAVGPYGGLMTSAYFVFSGALLALGIGLARALNRRARNTPGIMLLHLAALGTAVAGLAPVDVGAPTPVTAQGWIHRIAAIVAFASMTAGPLLLARWYRRDPGWRDLAWPSAVSGAVGLAGLAGIQLVLLGQGLAGAAQRVVLLVIVAWVLTCAFRLQRSIGPSTPTDHTGIS